MTRRDPQQLDFGLLVPGFRRHDAYTEQAEQLVGALRFVCNYYGHAVVADALGTKRPSVSQAIHEDPKQRNRHRLHLADLPWFVDNDPSGIVLVTIGGFATRAKVNAEERAVALSEAVLELYGSEGHKRTMRRAGEVQQRLQLLRARSGK